jgi:hypothetical protein
MTARGPFVIDEDTTDAFMDVPAGRYRGGVSIFERMRRKGYNLDDLATLATQVAERRRAEGKPELPPLPPPTDH